MNRYNALMQRIQAGEQILIDGATGTEVERRGVPQVDHAWNGGGALTHPDIVRQIHEDYIDHGAQIVISNTFATARHNLQEAGWEEHFDLLNRRGVELAIEARANRNAPHVLVAAGISHWDWNNKPPSFEALRANIEDQAAIMADAGADLIMLEMMCHLDKMRICIEAAQKTGLPVWVGLSCDLAEDGTSKLWHMGTVEAAIEMCDAYDLPLVSVMHTQVEHVDAALDVIQANWNRPIGVYAHSGLYEDGKWIFNSVISPKAYAAASQHWLARGVQVVGGCCGVGVPHIEQLHNILEPSGG